MDKDVKVGHMFFISCGPVLLSCGEALCQNPVSELNTQAVYIP